MNKKGLNEIWTTVLIILISVASIWVVWKIIEPSLNTHQFNITQTTCQNESQFVKYAKIGSTNNGKNTYLAVYSLNEVCEQKEMDSINLDEDGFISFCENDICGKIKDCNEDDNTCFLIQENNMKDCNACRRKEIPVVAKEDLNETWLYEHCDWDRESCKEGFQFVDYCTDSQDKNYSPCCSREKRIEPDYKKFYFKEAIKRANKLNFYIPEIKHWICANNYEVTKA